jgi:hypothetical protein
MKCFGNFDNERICDLCQQIDLNNYNNCKSITQQKIDAAKRKQIEEERITTEYFNFAKKCPYYTKVEVWDEGYHEYDYMACYKFGYGEDAPYCSNKFNLEKCTQRINEYNIKHPKKVKGD